MQTKPLRPENRRWHLRVALAFFALVLTVYLIGVPRTPSGFCLDESSIAFNAHLISTTGHDEHNQAWPLFFQAFGEYKNPIYIYLLAAVFKLAGPSNLVARRFSALLGFAAAAILGWLGWRITRRRWIALVTFLTALFTPNLFEVSRLVFE